MAECIRLLSDPHSKTACPSSATSTSSFSFPDTDPFSTSELTYSTNTHDYFPRPSAYPSRRYSWLHIFPEGMIHQHPAKTMRYFKWGVARLILESEPCPDVVAMWIDGPQEAMSEMREWPRPVPRPGKDINVSFGARVDREGVLEPLRERWRGLVERVERAKVEAEGEVERDGGRQLGVVQDEELKYGAEAEALRIEVTMMVRNEVLKVRRSRGLPDEDPKSGLAETFRREGPKREGVMGDGSVVKDM